MSLQSTPHIATHGAASGRRRPRRQGGIRLLIATVLSLLLADLPLAADREEVNILVLLSYNAFLPWSQDFLDGLAQTQQAHDARIHYFIETLNAAQLNGGMSDAQWSDYLADKYRGVQLHGVLAESVPAGRVLEASVARLPAGIPMVFYTASDIVPSPNKRSLIAQEQSAVRGTLMLALQQNPDATELLLIEGQGGGNRPVREMLQPLLDELPQLNVSYLADFSLQQLREHLAQLPPDSIVLFDLVFNDNTGQRFVPKQVLAQLAHASSAPIYSFWGSLMGSGVVGGHMIDARKTAQQMVAAMFDRLHDGQYRDTYDLLQTYIDWKAIDKHGIAPSSIPADASVLGRPPGLLQAYRTEIGLLGLALGLTLVISAFWVRKLTRVNNKLKREKLRAENLARRDLLTGLYNRRAFFEFAAQAYREARRMQQPVAIIMLDIDHFKRINDTHGHPAGDRVIQAMAALIEQTKRDIDISARFGGEEFIILLPATDLAGAEQLAERIRASCEAGRLDHEGREIRYTVSAGVNCNRAPTGAADIDRDIKQADDALYAAKTQGRNRVITRAEAAA